jgi:hypothetical protein
MAEEAVKIDEQPELPDVVVKVDAPEAVEPKDAAVTDLAEQFKELEAKSKSHEKERSEALERAATAERAAEAARHEAETARREATSSNLDTITQALATAQALADAAKRDKKVAREAGDFDAESEADERLIQARIDIRTYDEAKSNLEARKAAPPKAPIDPVEAYVRGRTTETANWLREHREFVIDPSKNRKLTAAHYAAVADDLAPDTKEYFEYVEKHIGLRKDAAPVTEGDDVQRPGAEKKKPAQRAVAPVGNSSANGGSPASNEVRLSAREAAAATDGTHVWNYDDPQKKFKKGDPIGVQEFARRKQKLTQQGAYDRTYETQ